LKPLIAITIGDCNGIGPEVALKSILHPSIKKICTPILVGPLHIFDNVSKALKLNLKLEKTTFPLLARSFVPVVDVGDGLWSDVTFGIPTKNSGRNAGVAIERAVELCMQQKVQAMVTAPSSKEALNLAGFNFPGQTEMIALLSHSQRVAMMLVAGSMRVGLVTIHTGIKNVAAQITKEKILDKLTIVHESLKNDFGIKKPRIAVLALNPHAGEKGIIGTEEDDFIVPALAEAKTAGIIAEGPFPADGFFGTPAFRKYDGILAMYNDQGLIPLKMLAFDKGVNFSAGLKIIRTSPDHGTAYDLAGKNKASISSMLEAIKLAVTISRNRKNHD
jgi:4-hydroxythreonine-4-phosphate dehydrogenase